MFLKELMSSEKTETVDMSNVIQYPFQGINYRAIASAITIKGPEKIREELMAVKWCETAAKVIVKRALKGGWGS